MFRCCSLLLVLTVLLSVQGAFHITTVTSQGKRFTKLVLQHSTSLNLFRAYMEDAHFANAEGTWVGVFDGHGGRLHLLTIFRRRLIFYSARSAVAKFISTHLYAMFLQRLPEKRRFDVREIEDALKAAVHSLSELVDGIKHWHQQGLPLLFHICMYDDQWFRLDGMCGRSEEGNR